MFAKLLARWRRRALRRRLRRPLVPPPPPSDVHDQELVVEPEPELLGQLRERGLEVYTNGRLNLVGVRTLPARSEVFDDLLMAMWHDGELWQERRWVATTDPGRPWLESPMRAHGAAVLAPGQYLDAYEVGLHRGRPALVQVRPVAVYRDADRDHLPETVGTPEWGLFALNIHDAPGGVLDDVGSASAGCQVVSTEAIAELLGIVDELGEQRVTYTLFELPREGTP